MAYPPKPGGASLSRATSKFEFAGTPGISRRHRFRRGSTGAFPRDPGGFSPRSALWWARNRSASCIGGSGGHGGRRIFPRTFFPSIRQRSGNVRLRSGSRGTANPGGCGWDWPRGCNRRCVLPVKILNRGENCKTYNYGHCGSGAGIFAEFPPG